MVDGLTAATPKLPPFRFRDAVAVVTGAAGGMGEHSPTAWR
jgi:hypothetical protein